MNPIIEDLFKGFMCPVSFLFYDGAEETYVVYRLTNSESRVDGDNELLYYVDYYDFDVVSKTNYFGVIDGLKNRLSSAGFKWSPSRSSGDMLDTETGYFHRTLCFVHERSV